MTYGARCRGVHLAHALPHSAWAQKAAVSRQSDTQVSRALEGRVGEQAHSGFEIRSTGYTKLRISPQAQN